MGSGVQIQKSRVKVKFKYKKIQPQFRTDFHFTAMGWQKGQMSVNNLDCLTAQ